MNRISVVVSTYDDPIDFVSQCLNSLLHQEKISEIIVVDSSKKEDIRKFCEIIKEKIIYLYTPPKGLSDARNKGITVAKNEIIAFTDPDCIVDNNWAENIFAPFVENVSIVGGKVLPKWLKPSYFKKSVIAQGFYSLFDIGNEPKEVDQIFGANFAINKNLVNEFFETELGRKKENLLCGEETELCNRIKKGKTKIIYNPLAIVWHQIPEERSTLKWMWRRIYYGGISRAIVGGNPTPKHTNSSYNIYDFIFLIIFIIPYTYGYLKANYMRISKS